MYVVATPSRRRSGPPEEGGALAGVVRMNVRGCSPNRGLRLVSAMAEKRPSPARASCALVMSCGAGGALPDREQGAGIEAHVGVLQCDGISHQRRREHDQHQRRGDLAHHQHVAQRRGAESCGLPAQRAGQRAPCRLERRHERKHDRRQPRGDEREREDPVIEVERNDARDSCGGGRERQEEDLQAGPDDEAGESQRDNACHRGDEESLGQELRHDAAAARAERQAHRDLRPPRGGAGEHDVRDVGAGGEQHDGEGGKDRGQYADELESERRRRGLREQLARLARGDRSTTGITAASAAAACSGVLSWRRRAITASSRGSVAPNRSCLITAPCIVDRHPEIRRGVVETDELLRHHADDRERLTVQPHRAADHRGVAVEDPGPCLVAEDDDGARPR